MVSPLDRLRQWFRPAPVYGPRVPTSDEMLTASRLLAEHADRVQRLRSQSRHTEEDIERLSRVMADLEAHTQAVRSMNKWFLLERRA